MFNKKFEERLVAWQQFRSSVETSLTPFEDTVNFFGSAPLVSMQVDPWTLENWPTPWELIHENQYCDFSKILVICYTLQLTDRFTDKDFEIHIYTNNKESTTHYLLFVQEKVIGYDWKCIIDRSQLPADFQSQQAYSMPRLY